MASVNVWCCFRIATQDNLSQYFKHAVASDFSLICFETAYSKTVTEK